MIEEYELVVFLLALIVLFFTLINRERLRQLPASELMVLAFHLFLASWLLTNLENFFWPDALNLLEHLTQASGAILIAIWSWRVFGGLEGRE